MQVETTELQQSSSSRMDVNPAWTITHTSTHLLMSLNWIKQETTTLSLLSSLVFHFLSLSSSQRMGSTDRLDVYMREETLCASVERHSNILPSCSRVRCGLDTL